MSAKQAKMIQDSHLIVSLDYEGTNADGDPIEDLTDFLQIRVDYKHRGYVLVSGLAYTGREAFGMETAHGSWDDVLPLVKSWLWNKIEWRGEWPEMSWMMAPSEYQAARSRVESVLSKEHARFLQNFL